MLFVERHEHVRRAEVAVVPSGSRTRGSRWSRKVFHVSSQARRWSWCRSSRVCVKTRSGSTRRLSSSNASFTLRRRTGMYAVREPVHDHFARCGGGEEALGARARLRLALSLAAEDDPGRPRRRAAPRESEQRAAAADLDVVGVAPIASTRRSGAPSPTGERASIRRASARWSRCSPTCATAPRPGLVRAPRGAAWSLIVSIGPKKPVVAGRRSPRRGAISFANVSSTSSSPGSIQSRISRRQDEEAAVDPHLGVAHVLDREHRAVVRRDTRWALNCGRTERNIASLPAARNASTIVGRAARP